MEEMKAIPEKEIIIKTETGSEPTKEPDTEIREGKSTVPKSQTELLQQINMKMDALLAANNISL